MHRFLVYALTFLCHCPPPGRTAHAPLDAASAATTAAVVATASSPAAAALPVPPAGPLAAILADPTVAAAPDSTEMCSLRTSAALAIRCRKAMVGGRWKEVRAALAEAAGTAGGAGAGFAPGRDAPRANVGGARSFGFGGAWPALHRSAVPEFQLASLRLRYVAAVAALHRACAARYLSPRAAAAADVALAADGAAVLGSSIEAARDMLATVPGGHDPAGALQRALAVALASQVTLNRSI